MKVYVIMANDFPSDVFADEQKADDHVKERMKSQECNCGSKSAFRNRHKDGCPRHTNGMAKIYYRSYPFEVIE